MLTVSNLSYMSFGPMNFVLEAGECVALVGPSGAGKSVLMRAIADLDPNQGSVRTDKVQREKISATRWRKIVALLPSESGWWAEDVAAHFCDPKAVRAQLPTVGLPEAAMDWEIARLSTGEKQRLALLRSLENAPDVLLLDEPTAALDFESKQKVETVLQALLAKGVAILIVTHDREQAARLAHRKLEIRDGKLSEVTA